ENDLAHYTPQRSHAFTLKS
ncbi:hypothetical protein D046_2329B, partial [Vibrio parahaemolyticus V-223/04]